MRGTRLGPSLVAAVLALQAPAASARALPYWPYDKLFKEADLVVIAKATAVEATDDQPANDDLKRLKTMLRAQTTSFGVLHVLKGKADGNSLRVVHFAFKPGEPGPDNGPGLMSFETKQPPDHLLFLRARKDGRYEPVTGEYDPDLSVRELRFLTPDFFKDAAEPRVAPDRRPSKKR
jgi:hypothetical protein